MAAGSEVADGPEENLQGQHDGAEHPRDDQSVGDVALPMEMSPLPADQAAVWPAVPPGFEKRVEVILSNLLNLISKPLSFHTFRSLKYLDLDLDATLIPPYIADTAILSYLASVAFDQTEVVAPVAFGPQCPPARLPLVPYSNSEGEDEVEEIEPSAFKAKPRKRRARKVKEQLDRPFVRRSKRLNPDNNVFRTEEGKAAASTFPNIYSRSVASAAHVAPHLSIDNIQGIATQYLKIQPEAVSACALLELDCDDDEA
ncbi:unnamed protein product [Urochloa humidicola]